MSKTALLIGLNYPGSDYQLSGCWNDVDNMDAFLQSKGFICEKHKDEKEQITAAKILQLITEFCRDLTGSAVIHYSGHGGSIMDNGSDERDGYDECLIGSDLENVLDDNIRKAISGISSECKLRIVLDCCHSGSGADLPWRCTATSTFPKIGSRESSGLQKNIVCVSGCKDAQTSTDAFIDNQDQGALTAIFLKLAKDARAPSWFSFLAVLQYKLKGAGYSQNPQLSYCNYDLPNEIFDFAN